jgi:hypothetical protein
MDFKPVSQNGIIPPTELGVMSSTLGVAVATTSSVKGAPFIINAISNAAIWKTVPVTFYSDWTTGTTTITQTLGTATWLSTTTAALVTYDLNTGTNMIYATWPGEGPYAPKTTIASPIRTFINSGYKLGGAFTVSASPTSGVAVAGESTVTLTASFNTSTSITGQVLFLDNHVPVGYATIVNNSATTSTIFNTTGTNVITASWGGGNIGGRLYEGSKTEISYDIAERNSLSALTLSVSPNPSVYGMQSYVLTATAQSTKSVAGTVTFYDGTASITTANLNNNVAAISLPATYFTTGTSQISAVYGGTTQTPKFFPATSNTVPLVVSDRYTTDLVISSNKNPINQLSPLVITVTATSPYATSLTGNVYLDKINYLPVYVSVPATTLYAASSTKWSALMNQDAVRVSNTDNFPGQPQTFYRQINTTPGKAVRFTAMADNQLDVYIGDTLIVSAVNNFNNNNIDLASHGYFVANQSNYLVKFVLTNLSQLDNSLTGNPTGCLFIAYEMDYATYRDATPSYLSQTMFWAPGTYNLRNNLIANTTTVSTYVTTATAITSQQFSGNTANFVFNPSLFQNTTSTTFRARWNGQYGTGIVPYNSATSSVFYTEQVNTGTLTLSSNLTTATHRDPIVLTALANTSSVIAGTVEFYKDSQLMTSTNITSNVTQYTIPAGSIPAGNHSFYTKFVGTSPLVTSNSITVTELPFYTATSSISFNPSEFTMFNLNGSINTSTLTITANLSSSASLAPGVVTISDDFGVIATATASASTVATIIPSSRYSAQVGTRPVTVSYSGNDSNASVITTASITLSKTPIFTNTAHPGTVYGAIPRLFLKNLQVPVSPTNSVTGGSYSTIHIANTTSTSSTITAYLDFWTAETTTNFFNPAYTSKPPYAITGTIEFFVRTIDPYPATGYITYSAGTYTITNNSTGPIALTLRNIPQGSVKNDLLWFVYSGNDTYKSYNCSDASYSIPIVWN